MKEYKHILVAGAGVSGICASKLIARNKIRATLFDENKKGALTEESLWNKLGVDADRDLISLHLGELTDALLSDVDCMVISPGISLEVPFVEKVRAAKIEIIGEIELAWQFEKGSVAAITGTNGKTTTTTLVGEIMKAANPETFVVGNIGIPYTSVCDRTTEHSVSVAEISSFQLETIKSFHPRVSAVLNLTPDHMDRHHTFDNYANCKFDIAKYQTEEDYCVLNADDEETVKRADRLSCKKIFFSRLTEQKNGVYVKNGNVVIDHDGNAETVMPLSDFKLLGSHNVENLLASVAISYYMGADIATIARVCSEFKGVAHRIEFVRSLDGVNYYNDSKGTNPDAAIKGIRAMDRPTLLIGGGYDKKIPFDDWILAFDGKVKRLVLIGQTREIIADCARSHGFTEIAFAESLEQAIDDCRAHAEAGDAVLLSPACASWGMFDNYEQRGDMFRDYVNQF